MTFSFSHRLLVAVPSTLSADTLFRVGRSLYPLTLVLSSLQGMTKAKLNRVEWVGKDRDEDEDKDRGKDKDNVVVMA